jgi:hypothetical protein
MLWKKLALLLVTVVITVELVCQVVTWQQGRQWAALRGQEDHYFVPSPDALLAYELAPDRSLLKEGRSLHINHHGIRDESDDLYEGNVRLAVLGDSVIFGIGFSQEQTISGLMQRELDADQKWLKVLNFGVPGYGLDELLEFLKVKDAIYHVQHVAYVLNPNDFARRNTVYEGADNGLYRMYHRDWLAMPWLLRKLVYRIKKGGSAAHPNMASVEWYRWLFEGNREHGCGQILAMSEYCRQRGVHFTLVLYPAGCAYSDGTYRLADVVDALRRFSAEHGIDVLDCTPLLADAPQRYFDGTDHLQLDGNRRMAGFLVQRLRPGLTAKGGTP